MEYDLVIIGCGTMGVATALAAARKGASVLAIDRASIPNEIGSHAGGARMFRTSYYEHPDYVPLLKRSFALWHDLQREARADLFHVTGGLYLGRADGQLVPRSAAAARLHGIEHEELDAGAAMSRWPQFRIPDGVVALFEPAAGVLRPESCVSAMASLARDAGATIGTFEEVTAVDVRAGRGRVRVTTNRSWYQGSSLVVTSGAWAPRVLGSMRGVGSGWLPPLRVTRQPYGWLAPKATEEFLPAIFPAWAFEEGAGSLLYGFPVLPGDADMRFARHSQGRETDPDATDRAYERTEIEDARAAVESLTPRCGDLTRSGICLYTNSPDSHFIVDRVPECANAFIACGFSGHGFKFAPVIGEILAELALDGGTSCPIDFLSLARFASRA